MSYMASDRAVCYNDERAICVAIVGHGGDSGRLGRVACRGQVVKGDPRNGRMARYRPPFITFSLEQLQK